ncbi:MAG: cytochrome c biogenesis protein ResB, partial [Candidatus Hydrogenedentes bacterium]|nr:cytochrome c biogenesis protein ResB [Candidatus Hydrogenedentota bacterium]
GTETPKAFESYVTKIEGDSHEKLKIHMNHPLRHRGYTFFQASFGADQTGAAEFFSVFSVVRNPADQVPLVACIVISIGLIIHFSQKLFRYLQVENKRRKA